MKAVKYLSMTIGLVFLVSCAHHGKKSCDGDKKKQCKTMKKSCCGDKEKCSSGQCKKDKKN